MTATLSFADLSPPAPAMHGSASSSPAGVKAILRLEGAAALAAAIALYAHAGFSWPLFAALILAPDLAMLPYLIGPRAGAAAYNLVHTYSLALPLALAGYFLASPLALALGLIWIAHIGTDRMLGYGLKYASGFHDTHLGSIRGKAFEDFAAGGGDGLVGSRSDFSQQGFELGEELFDRVEVRGVFRQEDEASSDVADRLPHGLAFVRAEIVEDHDIAGLERRDEELFDIGAKALAVDGAVEQAGRVDAV